jgi:acetyltransferase-like isoleucine patch superfamily enzyme
MSAITHVRIGALAVVTKSVPAWAVVAGNPGRVIRIDDPGARN